METESGQERPTKKIQTSARHKIILADVGWRRLRSWRHSGSGILKAGATAGAPKSGKSERKGQRTMSRINISPTIVVHNDYRWERENRPVKPECPCERTEPGRQRVIRVSDPDSRPVQKASRGLVHGFLLSNLSFPSDVAGKEVS